MKHNICPTCNNRGDYCERFDAIYCYRCDTWLEKNCGASGCIYCGDRPEKPSLHFLGIPKTFDKILGVVYSLEHFKTLEVSGSIMQDDGHVAAIFIDGVDRTDLCISGWSIPPQDFRFAKYISLDDLTTKFPDKTIQLEWCNK
jgi:hypothetical protein